jgi:hypothetical protein
MPTSSHNLPSLSPTWSPLSVATVAGSVPQTSSYEYAETEEGHFSPWQAPGERSLEHSYRVVLVNTLGNLATHRSLSARINSSRDDSFSFLCYPMPLSHL